MAKCHLQPDKSPLYLAVTPNSFINCDSNCKKYLLRDSAIQKSSVPDRPFKRDEMAI